MRSHRNVTAEFNQGLVRLFLWAVLMCTALIVTAHFDLGKTVWVTMVFLPMMPLAVFLPVRRAENTDGINRFWRFALWVCLLCIASLATMELDLRKTIFVPVVFLPLLVPMVLMPFKRPTKTDEPA